MLPDLEPEVDGEIIADNIRAVQAVHFACQLDDMHTFQVLERLAQLFQQGLLPLGPGRGRRLLQRYATAADRLSAQERNELYVRALGVPAGAASDAQPNREFHTLWLRLVASVALFERQQNALGPGHPSAALGAAVWRAARALAANASAHGAGLVDEVRRLAADANALRAVLEAPDIQQAFGARDMWQVIDRVASLELGGAVDVKRLRSLAQAGSSILQWLAEHAHALNKPGLLDTDLPPRVPALIDAVALWLASSTARHGAADNGSKPAGVLAIGTPLADLQAMADELMHITGLQDVMSRLDRLRASQAQARQHGLVAVFAGAAGTGKTLGAHTLAATVSRDLMRVDLRQVIGKYIGETEKNLDAILSHAERTGALLLLDEADALFARRTEVHDARDRYATVNVDSLLQRLQAHQGVVILESNVVPMPADGDWKTRLDPVVRFPRPPRG
jgi:hypothetical protein